jgi:RNA polymerase sigma-70 factor (ECF subfamily)
MRHELAQGEPGATTDRALLEDFAQTCHADTFAALVKRHGPLVLGVCRRVLCDGADADDAFQATFLVLARKAGSIGQPERLGNWLYGVATRIALKARASAARRRERQEPLTDLPARQADKGADREDLRRVLDDELCRLPDKFRAPLVLCYLDGKSREEAAAHLGWSVGAVKGMLERGRELLRSRLARRGLGVSAAGLAALLPEYASAAVVPPAVSVATAEAAVDFAVGKTVAAVNAAALAKGVLQSMNTKRLLVVGTVVLVVTLSVAAAGVLALGTQSTDRAPPRGGASRGQDVPGKDGPKVGLDLLQGAWNLVETEYLGTKDTGARVKDKQMKMVVQGDKAKFTSRGDDEGQVDQFTLNPAEGARAIDKVILTGDSKGQKILGIYKLEGDTLTFCWGGSKVRPTAFAARPTNDPDFWVITVYQREKK